MYRNPLPTPIILILLFLFAFPYACEKENNPPVIEFISPLNGEEFLEASEVSIAVRVTDKDGSIEEVILYIDDIEIVNMGAEPYPYTWNTAEVSPGTHFIKVEAIDDEGGSSDESIFVKITEEPRKPAADFEVSKTIAVIDEDLTFTDLSTENPSSWDWDFGDGFSSSLQNPSHSYDAVGEYTVELIATNENGSDTITKVNFINVTEPKPTAAFTADKTSAEIGEELQFTDQSTEDPTSWDWDFGDGSSSALQHPKHSYSSSGTYTVELIAANKNGADTLVKQDYITIAPLQEALVLLEYLEAGIDPISWIPRIKTAADVQTLVSSASAYVIDIRDAATYEAGHIENAVNIASNDVLAHLKSTDLTAYSDIVLVCYSGQTSVWLATLLRMSGFDNVSAMKWGMCSWHEDFASPWISNVSSTYTANFETSSYSKAAAGNLPVLETGLSTVEEILSTRVNTGLAEGFGAAAITAQMVFDNLEDYYIVNYWSMDHYTDPGHIPGAIQYTPKEALYMNTDLLTLPTDKTIVVYDYTNQTATGIVAYLRVLGYDAVSIKFGANAMIYDTLPAGQWDPATIAGYAYVSAK